MRCFTLKHLVTPSSVLKPENLSIQDNNFTGCFIWCETWHLTLSKEYKLGVSENRALGGEYLDLRGRRWQESGEYNNEELHS
jgi:hypothetical protein